MKFICGLLLCAVPVQVERIVVIVADDVGVDRVGAYAEHPDPGRTPNIDRLAERGLLFRNAWSNPLCGPSRACLLTGRYGFRTGVGTNPRPPLFVGFQTGLPESEVCIPAALGPSHRKFALGKWHLADSGQIPEHPNVLGFDYFAGPLYNLGSSFPGENYFFWNKTTNGVEEVQSIYATIDTADETVAALQHGGPSFLWAAFSAAHVPRHAPPAELHTFALSGNPDATPIVHTKAMIEALDTEIGRILDAVGPDTIVFFLGDNGTDAGATDAPFPTDHAKGTLYEGGVNVPLIVAGPGVLPGECAALVNLTDVFATVMELAGRASQAEDSISLVPYFTNPDRPPLRRWVYAERFVPNGHGPYHFWRQAIRGERFKLVRRNAEPDELYDLAEDPFEQENLLASGPLDDTERRAYLRLVASLPFHFE